MTCGLSLSRYTFLPDASERTFAAPLKVSFPLPVCIEPPEDALFPLTSPPSSVKVPPYAYAAEPFLAEQPVILPSIVQLPPVTYTAPPFVAAEQPVMLLLIMQLPPVTYTAPPFVAAQSLIEPLNEQPSPDTRIAPPPEMMPPVSFLVQLVMTQSVMVSEEFAANAPPYFDLQSFARTCLSVPEPALM